MSCTILHSRLVVSLRTENALAPSRTSENSTAYSVFLPEEIGLEPLNRKRVDLKLSVCVPRNTRVLFERGTALDADVEFYMQSVGPESGFTLLYVTLKNEKPATSIVLPRGFEIAKMIACGAIDGTVSVYETRDMDKKEKENESATAQEGC